MLLLAVPWLALASDPSDYEMDHPPALSQGVHLALRLRQQDPVVHQATSRQRDWVAVDRRARAVYTAGWITGVGGMAVELLGIASNSAELQLIGALGETVGAPMMAGGSLRSQRALTELGGRVTPAFGHWSWGLWGSTLALRIASASSTDPDTATILSLTGAATFLGSYITAVVQHGANQRARRDLGLISRLQPGVLVVPSPSGVWTGASVVMEF